MNSLVQNRKRKIWPLVLVSILLLVGILFGDALSYLFTNMAAPIARLVWNIEGSVRGNNTSPDANSIFNERMTYLENENETLRESRASSTISHEQIVHILSSLNSSPFDTFIIENGEDGGIEVGDRVFSLDGVALGMVIEVYSRISKVELFSAADQSIEALLDGKTRISLHGEGNQNFFTELPQGVSVSASSTLWQDGEGAYMLAKVEMVKNNPGDAFQKVYARSPLNIHNVRFVYIRK